MPEKNVPINHINDSAPQSKIEYGCLFCRSGSEERIICELNKSYPEMDCISPKRVRVRRQGEREISPLFPGYIFFQISSPIDFRAIYRKSDIYKVLQYPTGDWKLHGSDLHIAMLMYEMKGIIGLSKVRYDGDGIKILSGPLKGFENDITKIDKRAKTAQVTISFLEKKLIMWLGFEIDE